MEEAHYKLKILSGDLCGAEFSLAPGDTVFHVGPQRDLLEGVVAETIARADNTYYLPGDLAASAFAVRIVAQGEGEGEGEAGPVWCVELGERVEQGGAFRFRPLGANVVESAVGVHLALRADTEAWAAAVLDFAVSEAAQSAAGADPAPRRSRRRFLWLGAPLLLVLLALGGYAAYGRYYAPETRMRTLEDALKTGPVDYDVVYGRDERVYVFSDAVQGAAWGQRASQRLQRDRGDAYINRSREAERLGALLSAAGIDYAVVRLREPQRPVAVLSGDACIAEMRERATRLLSGKAPYAREIGVECISDGRLIALAQDGLRALGISTRVDTSGARSSLSNDAYLDDATLRAMAGFSEDFRKQWGRRIAINIRLWDDLLKGRSYQYDPGQLLAVGDGRWEFSTQSKH